MRATNRYLLIIVGLTAASSCANGVSEPAPAATQGDEALPVLEPQVHMFANDVQQAGAKLATPTATKLADLPKCQAL